MKIAAKMVCQDLEPDLELSAKPLYADCVRNAIGDAIVKLSRPAVTPTPPLKEFLNAAPEAISLSIE
jgi:hypothetical protein